jgi:hypothetical protein
MVDDVCATFLLSSENIFKLFDENINNSKNLNREIKINLVKCVTDLVEIIRSQNNLINNEKIKFMKELKNQSERHFNAFTDVNKRLDSIESHIQKKTYAEVIGNKDDSHFDSKERHVVIIKPSDNTKTSKETKNLVKQSLKPRQLKIGIKSTKFASKGGLVVECQTPEECDTLSEEITKNITGLNVERPTKKRPTIIVRNINPNISEKELLDCILENNKEISDYLMSSKSDINNEIKLRFKFRKQTTKMSDKYCLEISPILRKTIMKSKTLFICWELCPVEDSLPIVRCFKCNGFGHKSNQCKSSDEICGHCNGGHKTSECQSDKSRSHCCNCEKSNKNPKLRAKLQTNHSSYSQSCPSLIRIKNLIKSRISYE